MDKKWQSVPFQGIFPQLFERVFLIRLSDVLDVRPTLVVFIGQIEVEQLGPLGIVSDIMKVLKHMYLRLEPE
jgi:hypothetical protein